MVQSTGSTRLSDALAPWRSPLATHDPAKVLTDLAVSPTLGGDCLADIVLLRAQPELFGLMDLTGWPPGMRVLVRKERPHPGAQLRITRTQQNRQRWKGNRQSRPPEARKIRVSSRGVPHCTMARTGCEALHTPVWRTFDRACRLGAHRRRDRPR